MNVEVYEIRICGGNGLERVVAKYVVEKDLPESVKEQVHKMMFMDVLIKLGLEFVLGEEVDK